MAKTALITGITGQDGSYLAELLIDKGYEIYGLIRRLGVSDLTRLGNIIDRITFLEGDLTDQSSLNAATQTAQHLMRIDRSSLPPERLFYQPCFLTWLNQMNQICVSIRRSHSPYQLIAQPGKSRPARLCQ